jgi:hypothetical protein
MQMSGGNNSMLDHLKQPDYMHILLNPLPVYGLAMGVLALFIALLSRRRPVIVAALILIFVSGFSALPVYYFGEEAYDRVKAMSDPMGAQWLDEHMARAEKLIYLFYVLAAAALAGILAPLKWPRTSLPIAIATLVLGAGTMGVGGWISYAGGHVRHAEFRFEPPPAQAEAGHTHGGSEQAMDHGAKSEMKPGSGQEQAQQPMQHEGATGQPPTKEQIEASRLQLEASRLQLEASRKQLEAADAAKKPSPSPAPQQSQPSPTPEGHEH